MSFNTPSKPSLVRSSVTPPGEGPAVRRRSSFRMKPQSERLKRHLHLTHPAAPLAARKHAEQYRKMDDDRDDGEPRNDRRLLIELDSDDAGAGPLDKDDAPYQGRSGRSRVQIRSVRAARDGSKSRRQSSRNRDKSLEAPSSAQPRREIREVDDVALPDHGGRVPTSSSRSRKTYKSAAFVDDSEDYDSDHGRRSAKRSRRGSAHDDRKARAGKKARRHQKGDWSMTRTPSPPPPRPSPLPTPPPAPPLGSDTELPTPHDVVCGNDPAASNETSHSNLFDVEAVESGEDDAHGGDERSHRFRDMGSEDDYDYGDPFINDEDIESEQSDDSMGSYVSHRRRRSSTVGGSSRTHSRKKTRLVEYSSDDEDGAGPVELRRLTRGRPSNLPRLDSPFEENNVVYNSRRRTVDFERNASKAVKLEDKAGRRGSLKKPTELPLGLSATDKGKSKAPARREASPQRNVDVEAHVDANLSDMSEWERAQFELAVQNSRRSIGHERAGETSSYGSQMSTSRAAAMFASPSPLMSTPDARAMFTTPSSTASGITQGSKGFTLPTDGSPMSMEELVRRSLANAEGSAAESPAPSSTQPPPPLPRREGIQLTILCTESSFPAICECSHPSFQDPILKQQYRDLPNLLGGHIEPWGHTQGRGFVMFSAWGKQCPRMNAHIALAAVNFKESGYFRNPSRCSPVDVGLYAVPGQRDRFHFYCAGDDPAPLVAVSAGMLDHSQLLEPSEGGLRQRWLKAVLHNQEWQRYKGFIRMVSGHDFLYSQYNKHALQFSTRPLTKKNDSEEGKTSGGLRVPASQMFGSGGASSASPNRLTADTFSLPAESRVPVYDARRVPSFDFNKDLPRLAEVLPLWSEGEVPVASFVVIGHTITVYRARNGNWTLACNIQWAIVVGSSRDD